MDRIANILDWIHWYFTSVWQVILNLFNSLLNIWDYVYTFIKTLYFWLISLLTSVISLVEELFEWTIFWELLDWFNSLWFFIWVWSNLFVSSLLFVIIVRIWIAFVFKTIRLNLDYKRSKDN